jgi:hypothetical protein
VVSGSIGAGISSAQIPEPAAPPVEATPIPPQVAPLEEGKLDQYAVAFVAIEKIEQDAKARLSQAKDPVQKQEIRAGAEDQIFEAVERSGLQLNEYNQIAELAAKNDALRAKLESKIERRRGG